MAKKNILAENPGMVMVLTFFNLFVINGLVVWLANSLFPQQVVLGTQFISKGWAIIHSMGTLALLGTFAIPFIREYEKSRGKMFSSAEWMVAYFVLNFVGIWLVARLAEQLGFGISSWVVALVLAVVLDVVQGMAMMQVEKLRTQKA
ncbi:MAG: hypothetical protein A3A65_04125 [Candidatus Chisholmbacteria bacterium RIFCSPLOWO2_01_FULL_49_14]|uniref:Uncharacterized protein n=1 Tax=Candidatus Chisholmbacteria bacterium RIFCSPLOWO2_01_FULL_49_14 TaxID=1797593 RepID=A0A1G1VV80_9BACT|nr:MAG: hypothetical protein A3A65_04125 [Candidatus Chisholmbacteria bacterium RIFCSPLOWO2_01_FULL_49_14]